MAEYALVGDFGGTNARLALASDGKLVFTSDRRLEVWEKEADLYADAEDAIAEFLSTCPDQQPTRGVIAIAAPILGDEIRLTNCRWVMSRARLTAKFGFDFWFENDFASLAKAIPYLVHAKNTRDYQIPGYCTIGPDLDVSGTRALIGPGTGLGVAGLIPVAGGWIDVPSEGGHVTMAARTAEERAILNELRNEKDDHISAERALSGPGLVSIYRAYCKIDGVQVLYSNSRQITAAMRQPTDVHSRLATRTFKMFCSMLGTIAGNLALTFGAKGGLYIAGGILRDAHCELNDSIFRERFVDKGRFKSYLEDIPTYLIIHPYPAMEGLARISN